MNKDVPTKDVYRRRRRRTTKCVSLGCIGMGVADPGPALQENHPRLPQNRYLDPVIQPLKRLPLRIERGLMISYDFERCLWSG